MNGNFSKKNITDVDIENKRVLLRCDFNVPLDEKGNITDNTRIVKALDTINYIISRNAKLVIMSHLGRPKGEYDAKYSLKPVKEELERLLNHEIILAKDVIGEDAKTKVNNMKYGDIVLLENVRFEKGEKENSDEMSKELSNFGEIYVNDAFGTAHRAHSSTAGITKYLPAYAGFLMKEEIEYLKTVINDPERPFLAILGGAKVSDKLAVIYSLLDKVDEILIGGGMVFTLFKAMGYNIGKSLVEEDRIEDAKNIIKKAEEKNIKLVLPVDVVVTDSIESNTYKTVNIDQIPNDLMGVDIGEKTIENMGKEISKAMTIIWNGPLGVFEYVNFAKGTKKIAEKIADTDCVSIVGGGDSAAAVKQLGLEKEFSHISTGGGATLELLEGKKLPGVESLLDKK